MAITAERKKLLDLYRSEMVRVGNLDGRRFMSEVEAEALEAVFNQGYKQGVSDSLSIVSGQACDPINRQTCDQCAGKVRALSDKVRASTHRTGDCTSTCCGCGTKEGTR